MISTDIQALRNSRVRLLNDLGPHLMTTQMHPLLYRPITKCGSTFMRNVFWYLDHGTELPSNSASELQVWAKDWSKDKIAESQHKFVIVRHPVQRFMSLYFDKILGNDDGAPKKLSKAFVSIAKVDPFAGQDVGLHQQNCHNALDFIENLLQTQPLTKINWHWKPQMVRMSQLRDYGFSTLHLEGLNWQLPQVIGDLVPDIGTVLQKIKPSNKSNKPVQADAILTDELRIKIRTIYKTDYRVWKEVRNFWRDKKG